MEGWYGLVMTPVEPDWHRRLRIKVREVFRGADAETQAAFRAAITMVVTLSTSSLDLDESERLGFDAVLNDVERGVSLIRLDDDGRVVLCRGGWCYRVSVDPLEVVRTAET